MSGFIARSIFIGLLLMAMPAIAKVSYQVSITEPAHHFAEVSITLPAGMDVVDLKLPAWRTGKYQIINQANGIRNFTARDQRNRALDWQKVDKSHWQIKNPGKQSLTVSYSVYANELGLRSRHIDSTHGYLDGAAVFMYVPQLMLAEHSISLTVPADWNSFSGMNQIADHQFVAKNYHQLASSPIETGINKLSEFSVDGKDYQLVVWGEGNYNLQTMTKDLKALVAQGSTVWSDYPFEKYVFIVHATSGAKGATEHLNSTVIQRERFKFAPRKEYLKFLRTASHEFVHTWNVKAYRPEALVPYDYQQENYSELLWVAEGSTSYLQDHLLLTAKLQTPKEFFKVLAERIQKFERSPGSNVQSIADSSLEKWISQSGDFAANHSVNIYSEGFIVSWLLDDQILQDSNLQSSYKNLHAELYNQRVDHQTSYENFLAAPFSSDDMQNIAKQLTGKDYSEWWMKNVDSPLEVDFESLLERAGLQYIKGEKVEIKPWTGFKSKNEKGFMSLVFVEKNGPAWEAGLSVKDIIIAIDGVRATHENHAAMLEKYAPGRKVEITYFRNDQLMKTELEFASLPKKPLEIGPVKEPNDAQKAYFKAWLGIDYPTKESEQKKD